MKPVLTTLMGGVLPFAEVSVALFFIITSIWSHQLYCNLGYLFLSLPSPVPQPIYSTAITSSAEKTTVVDIIIDLRFISTLPLPLCCILLHKLQLHKTSTCRRLLVHLRFLFSPARLVSWLVSGSLELSSHLSRLPESAFG